MSAEGVGTSVHPQSDRDEPSLYVETPGLLLQRSIPNGTTKTGQSLAERIEQEIIQLNWPVGESLGSESELIGRYNVSRQAFREAVRLLESQRVAEMRRGPGGGLFVSAPDGSSVTKAIALFLEYKRVHPAHLLQARIALEMECVRLVAARLDKPGVARLQEIVERERDAPAEHFTELAQGLHVALAEMTGNPVFEVFVNVLTRLTGEHAIAAKDRPEERDDQARHVHALIVEALAAGKAELAQRRMLQHLEAIGPWLR